jgi:IS1 family transposase
MVRFGIRNGIQRYRCRVCRVTRSDSPENPLGEMRVPIEKAVQVVSLLCESTGIRACERLTSLNRRTILNILEMAGQKAADYSDANVRNFKPKLVQADEMHCFVFCRQQNNKDNIEDIGEQFMFLAVDRDSKLIISSVIGRRTRDNADLFMQDLRARTITRFQLTTDNWKTYSGYGESSVMAAFGTDIDYATEKKIFAQPIPYLPRKVTAIRRKRRIGDPDMSQATVNHCERTNLSVRLFTRRFTRCTLGYSKKLENLKLAAALFIWHFNWVRKHSSIGMTPAMAAGLTDKPMTIEELLNR